MKLKVYTTDGASSADKDFDLPSYEGEKGLQALKELIVLYQANARQGNASAKTRAEVAGTGKKAFRQKGTGNARSGDRQSPIYVGGGAAHGPKPKDWSKSMNKKTRKLAFSRAVFDKATDGEIALIEAIQPTEPKTKVFNSVLSKIEPKGKVLLVDGEFTEDVIRAARNIERVHMIDADSLNAWDLVRFDHILISEKGFEKVLARAK